MLKEVLKDMFVAKNYELYVREKDVVKITEVIQQVTNGATAPTVGNCGWAKSKDLYFIRVRVTADEKVKICDMCGEKGIILYPETVGYTGYQFTV